MVSRLASCRFTSMKPRIDDEGTCLEVRGDEKE